MKTEIAYVERRPIKVLFASHGADLGGAERCLIPLVCGLDRSRFDPVVVVPRDGALVGTLRNRGVRVNRSPFRLWAAYNTGTAAKCHLFRKNFPRRVRSLADLIESEQADVVVSNSMALLEGAYASRMVGRPHIWNVLEILSKDPGHVPLLPLDLVYSWLPKLTDVLVAVSAAVADEFRGYLPSEKIRIIHTGIHPPEVTSESKGVCAEFGFPAGSSIVQYVGLLSERKGVRTLMAAVPIVLRLFPQARFLLAGTDGGLKGFLESEIARLNLGQSVKLLGQRNDVGRLVSECTVFVLPANADPLPVAVLEAMSLGKPVIATRSGGCSEMVCHGNTGLLVQPQSPDELAQAISTVLANPELANRMGEEGRHRFQEIFSVDQYIRNFEQLINEIVNLRIDGGYSIPPTAPSFPPFEIKLATRFQATLLRCRERFREVRNSLIRRLSGD